MKTKNLLLLLACFIVASAMIGFLVFGIANYNQVQALQSQLLTAQAQPTAPPIVRYYLPAPPTPTITFTLTPEWTSTQIFTSTPELTETPIVTPYSGVLWRGEWIMFFGGIEVFSDISQKDELLWGVIPVNFHTDYEWWAKVDGLTARGMYIQPRTQLVYEVYMRTNLQGTRFCGAYWSQIEGIESSKVWCGFRYKAGYPKPCKCLP